MNSRPSWDEYFLRIATEVATRATCLRKHVGAVVVRDKHILTTGYNGSPHGHPHCTEEGCLMVDNHCIRTVHGEMNAIIQAALHGISLQGATIYTTAQPCHNCAKAIIGAGIVKVVFAGDYPDEHAVRFLKMANVELERKTSDV